MASSAVFQRALEPHAKSGDESENQSDLKRPAVETNLTRMSTVATGSPKKRLRSSAKIIGDHELTTVARSGVSTSNNNVAKEDDEQLLQLQRTLIDLKTANTTKDLLLRTTREELRNVRETANGTLAEYTKIRDEIRTIKQKMAREHQAVVYRKDIELFALRKGNEQKENYIMEHDAKLDEVFKQQKATLELKDVQLKMLKERLAHMDRQNSPKFSQDGEFSDGDQALQVRLLRIKKGKANEEKDAIIARLEEQLMLAKKAADEVVSQQGELQRAWDIVKKVQASLREERDLHSQTKDQLQEMTVRLEEETTKTDPDNGRLPTIEEDRHELEAMFDAAQEDNLRLYAEVEVLEKRLRDANARMFAAEQEADSLKGQVKLEKAISNDLKSASPSVVHRVHFQRMEAQLVASQEALQLKENEIRSLHACVEDKDRELRDVRAEVDAAVNFHTQDQDEIESLKLLVAELQATKEQLMRDHERLASQRNRQRLSLPDHTSARSSGVTLIQELSPPLTDPSEEPLPTPIEALPSTPEAEEVERASSIQATPKRHVRSDSVTNRWSLMSQDQPPAELRHSRRKSLGLKDIMRRMVKIDVQSKSSETMKKAFNDRPSTAIVNNTSELKRPRTGAALSAKDKNALLRPNTAVPTDFPSPKPATPNPLETTSVPVPTSVRPSTQRRNTPRYYTTDSTHVEERPSTAAGESKSRKDDESKSSSRPSWGAANKLKRRSLF